LKEKALPRARSKKFIFMRKSATILLLAFLWAFIGCGENSPKPMKVPISPVEKKAAGPVPVKGPSGPGTEARVLEPPSIAPYVYNPRGKPDPFRPLVVERKEVAAPEKKVEQASRRSEEPGTPLEKMELSVFKLVAVIWNIPDPRAMVEDPGGKGYILTLGTRIGQKKGRVTKISSAGIVVTEKYESDGRLKTREVPLRLYAE
jgi:type IV pilus assembly protein PilP